MKKPKFQAGDIIVIPSTPLKVFITEISGACYMMRWSHHPIERMEPYSYKYIDQIAVLTDESVIDRLLTKYR